MNTVTSRDALCWCWCEVIAITIWCAPVGKSRPVPPYFGHLAAPAFLLFTTSPVPRHERQRKCLEIFQAHVIMTFLKTLLKE